MTSVSAAAPVYDHCGSGAAVVGGHHSIATIAAMIRCRWHNDGRGAAVHHGWCIVVL